YLCSKGAMSIYLVIIFGTLGSLFGALINYYLSYTIGLPFLLKYGRFIFINQKMLKKVEVFFLKHGEITIFVGRLIPTIRQYISIPAGLAKMNIYKFSIYTSIGAFIWVTILTYIGYFIGNNLPLIKKQLNLVIIFLLPLLFLLVIYYIVMYKRKGEKIQ
ncbi:MAG: DedA family protein, partial [Deferribacterota bacterium]|nr:DedA family protein [Deferribacterota bacterium]